MDGETLGGYQLLGRLGRGGMGEVWLAEDPNGVKVAIKTLRADVIHEAARFKREVEVLTSLDHPGIVRCLSGLEYEGQVAFYAMEFVPGRDLAATLAAKGQLTPAVAVDLTVRLLSALGAAHAAGIVHRDVKPGNVLVGPDGRPRLTDFGLARSLDATRLTSAGTILGSPAYMSPEQANGEEAGPASDLYSIGVMLFELLSGRLPFQAPTPLGVLRMHADSPPPNLSALIPDLPLPLVHVVERCLAKSPEARYPSADELRLALEAALTRHDDSTVFLQACLDTLPPIRPEQTGFNPPRLGDGGGDTAVPKRGLSAGAWAMISVAAVGILGLSGLLFALVVSAQGGSQDSGPQVTIRSSPIPAFSTPPPSLTTSLAVATPSATPSGPSGTPSRSPSTTRAPAVDPEALAEARRLIPIALGETQASPAARRDLLGLDRPAATQALDERITAGDLESYQRSAADSLRLEVDRGLGPFFEAKPQATVATGTLQFSFSPDGTRLLSLRNGEKRRYELWLREAGQERRLCQLPFRGEGALPGYVGPRIWSSDGRRIAVIAGGRPRAGWLDLESGETHLVKTVAGDTFRPGFHPSRPLLFYAGSPRWRKSLGASVYSHDLEKGEEREIWTHVGGVIRGLTVSPDGKRAAFFFMRPEVKVKGDGTLLCSLDLETGELTEGPPADIEDFFGNDSPHFYWLDAERLIHYRTEGHKFPVAIQTWNVASDERETVLPADRWVIVAKLDSDRLVVLNRKVRAAAVLKVSAKQLMLYGKKTLLVTRSGLRAVFFDFGGAKRTEFYDLTR
ncbi:MAG: protein kinase [Planctomycetes bacterium]|nr:protein kinase [Planctomycetota bacterium]